MLLIDETYFTGELSLPNIQGTPFDDTSYGVALALYTVGENNLEVFADKYVTEYLIRLFGRELTEAFLNGLAEDKPGEIWSSLKGQLLFKTGNYKSSPLANYVYFHVMRNALTKTTMAGEASPTFDHAASVSNEHKLVKAWNDMAKMTMTPHSWFCENVETYKEYIGCMTGRNPWSILQLINTFGI